MLLENNHGGTIQEENSYVDMYNSKLLICFFNKKNIIPIFQVCVISKRVGTP
jgi:hypothetical protein